MVKSYVFPLSLLLLAGLLVLPIVFAQIDNIFRKGEEINVYALCINSTNQTCGYNINCSLTAYYPNNSLLGSNLIMTNNGSGWYNYSFGKFESGNKSGDYLGLIYCFGDEEGEASFIFTLLEYEDDNGIEVRGSPFPNNRYVRLNELNKTIERKIEEVVKSPFQKFLNWYSSHWKILLPLSILVLFLFLSMLKKYKLRKFKLMTKK